MIHTRTARVGGVDVHWREAGAGRPVLLLHGLGASSYSWRAVMPLLAERYRVIAPDFPGFGRSGLPAPDAFDYRFEGISRWLVAFLDYLRLSSVPIAGNSMGGVIGLMTAMDAPDRVERLALLGTPVYLGDGPSYMWPMRWPFVGKLYEFLIGPWACEVIGRTAYKRRELMTPDAVAEYSLPLHRREGRRAVAEVLRRAIPEDIDERLARYRLLPQEILMIRGDSDSVLGLENARRFCREAPKARLIEVPSCGHVAQEEHPDLIARELSAFFA